jgi:hypothetical protein
MVAVINCQSGIHISTRVSICIQTDENDQQDLGHIISQSLMEKSQVRTCIDLVTVSEVSLLYLHCRLGPIL